jgi:hypothetical protein
MGSGPLDDEERRELEEALRLVLENLATLTAEQNRIAVLVARITEGLDEIAARSDRIAAILDNIDEGAPVTTARAPPRAVRRQAHRDLRTPGTAIADRIDEGGVSWNRSG